MSALCCNSRGFLKVQISLRISRTFFFVVVVAAAVLERSFQDSQSSRLGQVSLDQQQPTEGKRKWGRGGPEIGILRRANVHLGPSFQHLAPVQLVVRIAVRIQDDAHPQSTCIIIKTTKSKSITCKYVNSYAGFTWIKTEPGRTQPGLAE